MKGAVTATCVHDVYMYLRSLSKVGRSNLEYVLRKLASVASWTVGFSRVYKCQVVLLLLVLGAVRGFLEPNMVKIRQDKR